MAIKFLYRSSKDSAALRVQVLHKNFNFIRPTFTSIRKSTWDNHIIGDKKTRDAKIITEINNYKTESAALTEILTNYCNENLDITAEGIDDLIGNYYPHIAEQKAKVQKGNEGPKIPDLLVDYIRYYIEENKANVSPSTLKTRRSILNKIEAMELHFGEKYYLKDVDQTFRNKFQEWALLLNYDISVMRKILTNLKTVCYYAKDHHNKEIYNGLRLVTIKVRRDVDKLDYQNPVLTLEEIKKIFDCDKLDEEEDRARDFLIISIFTLQRVSDFLRFDKSMIAEDVINGQKIKFLNFIQEKTRKQLNIPLLEKYLVKTLEKRNYDFPERMTEQRYNELIKTVCLKSGINKKIIAAKQEALPDGTRRKVVREFEKHEVVSSHIGRRSGATLYYDILPIDDLMKLTGHTTEKSLRAYLQKDDDERKISITEKLMAKDLTNSYDNLSSEQLKTAEVFIEGLMKDFPDVGLIFQNLIKKERYSETPKQHSLTDSL